MLNRSVPLVVCLTALSCSAVAQAPQGLGYVVESAASGSGQFQVYPENSASFARGTASNNGPTGPNQFAAKPDGTKFYVMGANVLESSDPTFTTLKAVNGLSGTFSHEQFTPDGRFLLLSSSQSAGSGNLYVVNASNDTVVLNEPVSGTIIGVVTSRDSSTAWILGESSGTFITTINLSTMAQSGSPQFLRDPATGGALGGAATTFSMSPLGLLYVTAGNEVLEIDPGILASCQASPLTCSPTKVISINATPGPLQFTPDGAFAYFLNQTPNIGGQSIFRISLPGHNILSYPTLEAFDTLMVAGQTRILAHSASDTTLWDVAPDLSSVTVSTLQSVLPATQVYSAVISNELPSAQFLFVMAGGPSLADVYMVSLATNSVTAQAASSLGLGPLQFIFVPTQAPAAFTTPLEYNSTQLSLAAGATANPLIARFLDQNGNPVFAVPVTITGDPSQTITPVNTTTNADGYVQATVKMGPNPGPFPVTMTAGSGNNTITATFALTIPGGGGTGPGNGGGPNQLSIVTGNGQLFLANNQYFGPNNLLTVQLLDTHGNPLENYNVAFTVTGPLIAGLGSPNATTDANGMASTSFAPGFPPENVAYESTTVSAVATDSSGNQLGVQTFSETIFQLDGFNGGAPTVYVSPNPVFITGGEGDVIKNAFSVNVSTSAFGPGQGIPNIGIRIADANNPNNNGPGVCQGNPLTDQNGNVTCNFIPVCATSLSPNGGQIGLGIHGFDIEIGEYHGYSPNSITITAGSTQALAVGTGNNQNANPGTGLTTPLSVLVTDGCGTPIPGVTVSWKVTQGSATLSANSSVTVAGGAASTKATLGATAGTIKITATINGSTTVTFTETANAIVGSLSLTSGSPQSALENSPFGQPVVFTLKDNKGNPLPNFTVNFSLGGGSAALSATTAQTNPQGQASVNVTAGNVPGTVTVNATFGTFTASATLTVTAIGPNITASSFVNAASFQPGLAICGLATVTGSGLAAGISGVFTGNTLGIGPLPYTLQGVSITVNLVPAPILSVSNQGGVQQVNFQVPCESPTGSGTVVVQVNGSTTTVTGVTIYPTQPGIFTYAGPGGLNYAAVISQKDGSYLTPSNLAHVGQTYYMVVTGMGQTTPTATTNSPGTGGQTIAPALVTLAINNIGVPVTSVTYLQGEVGEYLIGFTIPNVTGNGQPFPTGINLPISLGGIVNGTGQTIYDTAQVALPGIN